MLHASLSESVLADQPFQEAGYEGGFEELEDETWQSDGEDPEEEEDIFVAVPAPDDEPEAVDDLVEMEMPFLEEEDPEEIGRYEPLSVVLPDQEQALGPPSPQSGFVVQPDDPDPVPDPIGAVIAPPTSYVVPITAAFIFWIIASQLN